MFIQRAWPVRIFLLAASAATLLVPAASAEEFVVNGDFSSVLAGWTNASKYFNGNPYVGGVAVVDDAPYVGALRLTGVDGRNYDVTIEQYIAVNGLAGPALVHFAWKVTNKEQNYGVNYVVVDFYNEMGTLLGRIIYFDTYNPNYTLEYFRNWFQTVPANAYHGVRTSQPTQLWQNVAVSTASMPGLDVSQVRTIWVRADVQNDATWGGELLVDDLSIEAVEIGDCNGNDVPDSVEIAAGSSRDCHANGLPDECEHCGDLDADGDVDGDDYTLFVAAFGQSGALSTFHACADHDEDGTVSLTDLQTWILCYRDYNAPPPENTTPAPARAVSRAAGHSVPQSADTVQVAPDGMP
jgi:hypothetical protein